MRIVGLLFATAGHYAYKLIPHDPQYENLRKNILPFSLSLPDLCYRSHTIYL